MEHDTSLMNRLRDAITEYHKIPLVELSYDSQRRAMARIQEDYANGLPVSDIDLVTVLGDPNVSVPFIDNVNDFAKYFEKSGAKNRKREQDLEMSKNLRMEERKSLYAEAGIALLVP